MKIWCLLIPKGAWLCYKQSGEKKHKISCNLNKASLQLAIWASHSLHAQVQKIIQITQRRLWWAEVITVLCNLNSPKNVTSHWLWDNTGLYMYFRCMLLNRKFQGNSCSTMHLYFLQNNFKSLTLLQNPFPSKWRIKNVPQGKRKLGKESRKKREWQLRAQWIKYFVHRSWKICHLHILKLQKQKFCIRNF